MDIRGPSWVGLGGGWKWGVGVGGGEREVYLLWRVEQPSRLWKLLRTKDRVASYTT